MGGMEELAVDVPAWLAVMDDEDLRFLKRFLICSGSLKALAEEGLKKRPEFWQTLWERYVESTIDFRSAADVTGENLRGLACSRDSRRRRASWCRTSSARRSRGWWPPWRRRAWR